MNNKMTCKQRYTVVVTRNFNYNAKQPFDFPFYILEMSLEICEQMYDEM